MPSDDACLVRSPHWDGHGLKALCWGFGDVGDYNYPFWVDGWVVGPIDCEGVEEGEGGQLVEVVGRVEGGDWRDRRGDVHGDGRGGEEDEAQERHW